MSEFRDIIYAYYDDHMRRLPWRFTDNPYHIFVSEYMLQQTQVERVIPKYERFVYIFGDFHTLAEAPFEEVLSEWKGLGYNRRARFMQDAAKVIVSEHQSILPDDREMLLKLPGLGEGTASSIAVFAYNKPYIFVETNIRTVYIHFFFKHIDQVTDAMIKEKLAATMDYEQPAKWYNALMDYGVKLKKEVGNLSRKSTMYVKQKPFKGSKRYVRGRILEICLENKNTEKSDFYTLIESETENINLAVAELIAEHMIVCENGIYRIRK